MYQWNAADYASHSQGQERWAKELLASIALHPNEHVLDVGCGDGRITAQIARALPQGRVLGVDLSADMIAHASAHFALPNLQFARSDASHLEFSDQFTLVFSNATLHWIRDHRPVLAGMHRALLPGGRLVAQMGGAGNAAALTKVSAQVAAMPRWHQYFIDFDIGLGFHHPDDYVPWLQAAGFSVEQCELLVKDMVHADVQAFSGWLHAAWHAYTAPVPQPLRNQFIDELTQAYVQAHPLDAKGQVHVQMVRLQVKAHKNA